MDDLPPIDPDYSASQREEIGRMDYLLAELRTLRDRGIVPSEAVAAVEAEKAPRRAEIERGGLASGALKAARIAAEKDPRAALALADRARALDPGQGMAWDLSATLLGRLGEFDRAIAVCREAADLHGHSDLRSRAAAFEADRARHGRTLAIEAATARARSAAAGSDLDAAIAACREVLELSPAHHWAIATAIGLLVETGRFDEAEPLAERLRTVSPREAADWSMRIRILRGRATAPPPPPTGKPEPVPEIQFVDEPAPAPRPKPRRPDVAAVAGPAFSAIAREFLEDHWQKLILSLAVLLIVVSSTVGAALVLGDRLWMAEGKCLLATAYTVMFAGFGRGLARWGAERAGRIMRLTTLIVLPVNFALVGELPGLGRSSPTGLAVLAIDSAAMMGLAWLVCRSLGISGGRGTPASLIAMGMIDALTPRSAPFGWVFATIVATSGVFAASGEWLARWLGRDRPPEEIDRDESPYFAFGLLTFYYLCAVGRLGGYVLQMPPTLYALPAMLAAFAAVRVAGALGASGQVGPAVGLLRLAGYGLSALAFALGLARPEVRLPLYSGNTLAAAVVGLALYGRGLRAERRPAFLYAGFAAVFLAYFGAHEFVKDYLAGFEGRIGHSLGYRGKLPLPFKAINGLAFNAALAGLSIVFTRKWRDDRLAWHCHLIGLPLSVGACILSGFDPLAAVLTMGGYAVAFGLATWLFEVPPLAYLACAAFAGSALAGTSYRGDLAAGARSLSLASVGLALWAGCRALAIERVPPSYRVPVVRSARAIAAVALALAALASWPSSPPTWTAAASCWALAGLYLLIGLETPLVTVATAAVALAAVAALLSMQRATAWPGWEFGRAWLGAGAAAIGLIDQWLGPWVGVLADRRAARLGRPSRLAVYRVPLFGLGLILAGLATGLVGSDLAAALPRPSAGGLVAIASTMGLVAVGLGSGSAWSARSEWLALATVLSGSAAAVAGAMAVGTARAWPVPASMALTSGGLGLGLVALGDRIRGRESGRLALYRRPLLASATLAIGLAWTSCGFAWPDARMTTAALTLTALALGLSVRQAPTRPVAHLALAAGLAAWLVGRGLTGTAGGGELPRAGLLVLIYLGVALAVGDVVRRLARGREPGEAGRVFGAALIEFATVAATLALAMGSVGLSTGDWPRLTGVLALGSAVFSRLAGLRRRADHVLIGLTLAWLATGGGARWIAGDRAAGILLGWLALVSAVDGLLVCGSRWLGRRRGLGAMALGPLGDLGILLAAASFALGIAGPVLTLDAYPMAVAALLLTIPALVAWAAMDRTAWRTYGAILAGVAAAYLTLFELGRGRIGHVSALGVLASLLAVLTWAIQRVASRADREEWRGVFAVPPRDATIALAILAIGPGWGQAGPLLLAALPFLLLIRAAPAAGWLYPALGLMVASGSFGALGRWGPGALTPWWVGSAFGCWWLGLGLWRWKPGVCRSLGLPVDLGYEHPPYHASMALGALALGLRLYGAGQPGQFWAVGPWVPAAVGVLSLLMLKPYPGRGWADGFVLLLSTAAILAAGLRPGSPMSWGLAALTLALVWRAAQRGSALFEAEVRGRLGVGFDRLAEVFHEWSLGLLLLGALPIVSLDVVAVLSATLGAAGPVWPLPAIEWREGLVAILLLGANVELIGRALPGAATRLGLHAALTMGLWWLVVPGSPVVAWSGLGPAAMLPLIAAAQALASAGLAARATDRPVALFGAGLAAVAVVLTGGRIGGSTTATLLLATAAGGIIAVRFRKPEVAAMASALWGLTLFGVAEQVARRLGWARSPIDPTALAVGQSLAAFGLVVAGVRFRRLGRDLARVVEGAAAVALAVASGAVGYSLGEPGEPVRALVGVGVMAGVASLGVVLATRWASMAMAFGAQGAILLGFAAFRSGYPISPMGDAAAMLILAGIDLGVAEVAGRGRRAFALPALATGLALPLISVGLSLRGGPIGDQPMFVLFAAGTFYAATCGRLRWRGLGYAAAVLYNAALWMLWARFGWSLAAEPQFFVVPVGFSIILFAEANARELGRPRVNAIRGAGLALIYLALAVPIWRTASLGAWSAVLGVSLLGIFAGIGLRSQTFLWLGLAGFVLDVLFQLGRIGMEHALAKWAIMLGLGVLLVLFVALNEKRQLIASIRKYVQVVRDWE